MSEKNTFDRSLRILVDGVEIAQGCRLRLTAGTTLSLRPPLHRLEIADLSESSAALLAGGRRLEVIRGIAVLASGEITEAYTRPESGRRLTTVIFSPGLSLWRSAVSFSIPAGMRISEVMRRLLEASGTGVPLAAFAAEDHSLSRPQAFFGRTCDALALLAETADADAFCGSAGVCVSGRKARDAAYSLSDRDLLSAPVTVGNRMILSAEPAGWMPGGFAEINWQGVSRTGRIISCLTQADNRNGPWKTEIELEMM